MAIVIECHLGAIKFYSIITVLFFSHIHLVQYVPCICIIIRSAVCYLSCVSNIYAILIVSFSFEFLLLLILIMNIFSGIKSDMMKIDLLRAFKETLRNLLHYLRLKRKDFVF